MLRRRSETGTLYPPASLGVIGGGQLGRMFVQAAQRMGYTTGVLSATEDAPAAQIAHWKVVSPPDRLPAIKTFAEQADAVTVEFEKRLGSRLAMARASKTCPTGMANRLVEPEPLEREIVPGESRFSARPLVSRSV